MPKWFYFSRPFNMACHDLTTEHPPPPTFRSLLGLGLNFCPTPETTTRRIKDALDRLQRDLYLKVYFAGQQELTPTKLFVRSDWQPPMNAIPSELKARMKLFRRKITTLFRPVRSPANLIPHQQYLLDKLQSSEDTLVVRTDKNLGPALVDRKTYIHKAFADHLSDANTYRSLSPTEASDSIEELTELLQAFVSHHENELGESTTKFLTESIDEVIDPYPHFYLTFKIHKTPLKTRPIVSVSGSLLHALGRWLDNQLQPLVRSLPSFIASSWELKNCLESLPPLPTNARLFTCDAVSMYTNIDTDHALEVIADFLRHHRLAQGLPAEAIIAGLEIIMRWNVFQFGDTYWQQLSGTAMGTPPACVYATLYFAIHELAMPVALRACLAIYKRYIDDGIGIWIGTTLQWQEFQHWINSFGSLRWTFTALAREIDYLDVTIRLDTSMSIRFTLFEKPLNLYLYLPPHSAHPPGVLTGLIYGMIRRAYRLTTDPADCKSYLRKFYTRLRYRGYPKDILTPLFEAGLANRAKPPRNKQRQSTSTRDTLFLHIPYHPANPPSSALQDAYRTILLHPAAATPLPQIANTHLGANCGVRRLVIAYHRPPNLANLLCPRKLERTPGPPVSAFVRRDSEGHFSSSLESPRSGDSKL
jgi:hypothetical protein